MSTDAIVQMTGKLDPRERWSAVDRCSIGKALDVVRTRSAFLVMREAFYGTTRFDDFAERVGLSDPVTASRLKELVDEGLLEREDYREPGSRTRKAYRLTDQGADLFPVLVALMEWGDRWENDGGGVELRHRDCGARAHIELRCEQGHTLESGDLELAVRPRRKRTAA
jgi:DNA-binding HxlR family transcriptional regulator